MGLFPLIGLGVGATVGSGIFSTISQVAEVAGSSLLLVLAFFVGALLQIPSNLCYAELASAYPEDGGYYVYFREAGWKIATFIFGWLTFLALDAPAISLMILAISNYLTVFFPWDPLVLRILCVCIVIAFSYLHIRSVEVGGLVQAFITTIKIIPFIVIIGVGIFYINPDLFLCPQHINDTSVSVINDSELIALLGAVALSYFSFDGMTAGCYVSGEIKNPSKTLPLGLILSAVIVLLLYFALTSIATGLMSIDDIAASKAPIADMASYIPNVGYMASPIIAIVAIVVIFGTISSCTLYMPRFEFAMARDGLFFKQFAKVHPKYKTPANAIAIFVTYAVILALFMDLDNLLKSLTMIILLKHLLTYSLVFVLRRKDNYHPTYKMPLPHLIPAICILFSAILLVFQFTNCSFKELIFNAVIIIAGILAYFIWKNYQKIIKSY